jgi:hypothetical protein
MGKRFQPSAPVVSMSRLRNYQSSMNGFHSSSNGRTERVGAYGVWSPRKPAVNRMDLGNYRILPFQPD